MWTRPGRFHGAGGAAITLATISQYLVARSQVERTGPGGLEICNRFYHLGRQVRPAASELGRAPVRRAPEAWTLDDMDKVARLAFDEDAPRYWQGEGSERQRQGAGAQVLRVVLWPGCGDSVSSTQVPGDALEPWPQAHPGRELARPVVRSRDRTCSPREGPLVSGNRGRPRLGLEAPALRLEMVPPSGIQTPQPAGRRGGSPPGSACSRVASRRCR